MRKITLLLLLSLLLLACNRKRDEAQKYSVSILPQKYFVERVVGEMFDIDVLVKPGESPATYEPTTKQMIDLSKTKALFTIGVAFEDNIVPKLNQQYPNFLIIDTDKDITKHRPASFVELFAEDKHHHQHETTNDKHHHHEGFDPHIWLSPNLVKVQVMNIADYFISAYPEQEKTFTQNRDVFLAELDDVSQEINKIFENANNRDFLCFHPAWGYFADEFHLRQIPIEIEGKEPTPQEQQKIIEFAQDNKIKFIFVQAQFDQRIARSVAQEIGGSVILIDPLAEDYLVNLKYIASKLAETMK